MAVFSLVQRQALESTGRLELPSDYSEEPEVITLRLIEDGRRHSIMNAPIPISCPVRILQGMKDASVPYEHALSFARLIESEDVEITLTPGGDHRLSASADLSRLTGILDRL
ncbi:MAG: hypothetical protein R3C58_01190 [Parvularculaceae bacterium]